MALSMSQMFSSRQLQVRLPIFLSTQHLLFFSLEMEPADMHFMEGFGLLEAMSAIEVCNAIVYSVLTHTDE